MIDLAKKHNYQGWYVGVDPEYADDNGAEIIFGPMSKRAATKKYHELQKVHGDHPYMTPVWCMSGRAMLADLVENAEREAGWYI